MKARLVPLYLDPGRDDDFDKQLAALRSLLGEQVEFLDPVALGSAVPEAEAVIFPQVLGEAYRQVPAFQSIRLPILLVTSEFGTLSMWDWEIAEYLRSHGVQTIGPYSLRQTQHVCRALSVQRELRETKFLVYQDDPGEGHQASIFKRFYWWEDECTERLHDKFGVTVLKKSFRELGAAAQAISDRDADQAWGQWNLPIEGLSPRAVRSAVKVYLAVRRDLDADPFIRAAGINCLNESHFSDTHAVPGLEHALPGAAADLGLRSRHHVDDHQVHSPPVARRADHDDESLSVPAGERGAEARADRELSGCGSGAREPCPGGTLRLHGGDSHILCDRLDAPRQSTVDRR